MNLFYLKNPKLLVVLVFAISLSVFSSCEKEEDVISPVIVDITTNIVGSYNGTINNGDGFASEDYDVTVTKVNNNTVKMTPEDENASTFEVKMVTDTSGNYVDTDLSDNYQVLFSDETGTMKLSYNADAEQFSGFKN